MRNANLPCFWFYHSAPYFKLKLDGSYFICSIIFMNNVGDEKKICHNNNIKDKIFFTTDIWIGGACGGGSSYIF